MSKHLIIKSCGECPYHQSEWSDRFGSYWIGMRCKYPGADIELNLDTHPKDTTHDDCPMESLIDYMYRVNK